MNLLSSLLAFTARQIAALRSADTATNNRIDETNQAASALTGRVSTNESNIQIMNGRLDTAISAVTTSTEVTDIRVGDDGVTYQTAGTAVRTQLSNLKSDLSSLEGALIDGGGFVSRSLTTQSGYISSSTGAIEAGGYRYSQMLKVKEGDVAKLVSYASESVLALAMYENISDSTANLSKSVRGNNGGTEMTVTIPSGVNYVRFCYAEYFASSCYIKFDTNIASSEVLENDYTSKYDINKIMPDNIMGFVSDGNITHLVDVLAVGKYVDETVTSHLSLATYEPYTTYIFAVNERIKDVTFGGFTDAVTFRIGFLASDKYTYVKNPVVATGTGSYTVAVDDAKYIAFSIAHAPVGVSVGTTYKEATEYLPPMWILKTFYKYNQYVHREISDRGYVDLPEVATGLKKGFTTTYDYVYSVPTSFAHVYVGYKTFGGDFDTNYVFMLDITQSTVTVKRRNQSDVTINHGLTTGNYVRVKIDVAWGGAVHFEIFANGQTYSNDTFTDIDRMYPFIHTNYNNDTTHTGLTWTCTDFNKKYWFFGDSYFSSDPTRWMQYYEYKDNILINGYAGESSYYAYNDLLDIIKYGNPKYIVWCMGMNDGSDSSESSPSTEWTGYRDLFLALCNKYSIEPIFGTIPTVQSVNNEGKNAWIRNSGYRYIDFAKAVGADANGNWYDGHISTADYVHPSQRGAIALCSQVYYDFPDASIG